MLRPGPPVPCRAIVTIGKTWPSVEAYYAEAPAGAQSSEIYCGMYWRAPDDLRSWEIRLVELVGEVIAVPSPSGPVELLASDVEPDVVRLVLDYLPTERNLSEARHALGGLADVDPATLDAFLAEAASFETAAAKRRRAIRRAGFVRCEPSTLPPPDVDVPADMGNLDWPTIGGAAAAALDAGVDPLDFDALANYFAGRLEREEQGWALSLFSDPIRIGCGYTGGRHRTACLQATSSRVAVISSLVAESAAKERLPRPTRPTVSWI